MICSKHYAVYFCSSYIAFSQGVTLILVVQRQKNTDKATASKKNLREIRVLYFDNL